MFENDSRLLDPNALQSRLADSREFLRDLLLLKLQQPLSDSLYSYRASRTLFRAYQFKPALKFLQSPEQHLLIGDEVGLGKTIEAAIIYLEQEARQDLRRVLVLCPAALKDKWYAELLSRFDEEFPILDTRAVNQFLDDYQQHGTAATLRAICSIELFRQRDFTRRLADLNVRFDLVIVDEAHHLRNPNTLSHALGEILADQSETLLLLTATPIHTDRKDLFHLMQLISPGEFTSAGAFDDRIRPNEFINAASRLVSEHKLDAALPELRKVEGTALERYYRDNPYYHEAIGLLERPGGLGDADRVRLQRHLLELNTLARVFTRTRKRDVTDGAIRCAHTIEVAFEPAERAFYDSIMEFVRFEMGHRQYAGSVSNFILIMRERQAASCIQALRQEFETAFRAVLAPDRATHKPPKHKSAMNSLDFLLDELHGPLSADDRRKIDRLLEICQGLGDVDTKFARFHEALAQLLADDPACKVLVFSFFRGTLTYLQQCLSRLGYRAEIIHGGIAPAQRQRRIARFQSDPSLQIMLTSDVGTEGLDFQYCSAMFNYDLPWNPMRVEQRIGRLDRFGQTHPKIQIYNLVIEGTIETRILLRLYDRIQIFESSVGDLETILGGVVRDLSRDLFRTRLSHTEELQRAEAAAERVERYRQEQEDFERQRLSFLGQDQLFKQDLEDRRDSGHFIAPDEVRSLVESFLATAYPRVSFDPVEGGACYRLTPDSNFVYWIGEFIKHNPRNLTNGRPFLQKLRADQELRLTFESEAARAQENVEFVTVHHPLAQFAAEHFRQAGTPRPPVTYFSAPGPAGKAGSYAFFVYRLNAWCLTPHSTLIPVLVNTASGAVEPNLSNDFLTRLQRRWPGPASGAGPDFGTFARLEEAARAHVADEAQRHEREIRGRNDALAAARLTTLDDAYTARIRYVSRQVKRAADERTKQTRRAQIANLEARLAAKKQQIEARRDVKLGVELICLGQVDFL